MMKEVEGIRASTERLSQRAVVERGFRAHRQGDRLDVQGARVDQMIQGKDREETVRLTAAALGISEADAEFIIAIELGEIDGDVVVLDKDGGEIRRPLEPVS